MVDRKLAQRPRLSGSLLICLPFRLFRIPQYVAAFYVKSVWILNQMRFSSYQTHDTFRLGPDVEDGTSKAGGQLQIRCVYDRAR